MSLSTPGRLASPGPYCVARRGHKVPRLAGHWQSCVPGPAHALGDASSGREDTGWVSSPHRPFSRVRRPWRRLCSLTGG